MMKATLTKLFIFSIFLLAFRKSLSTSDLLADDSEYKNLVAFDEMLNQFQTRFASSQPETIEEASSSIHWANLAMMFHQRNERWKQGGNAESLRYIELALMAQENINDNSHSDKRLRRSMMLHKAKMLSSLGQRDLAREIYDELLDTCEQASSVIDNASTRFLHQVKSLFPTTKRSESDAATGVSPQELSNILYHKAELLYTLYDEYGEAVRLFQKSIAIFPCNYLAHQHLVHAMKASKYTSNADWIAVIVQMEDYLRRITQRLTSNNKFKYKYTPAPVEFRTPNSARIVDRASRLFHSSPFKWFSYYLAVLQDWFAYFFEPQDVLQCHAGGDSYKDLFGTLGKVRTVATLSSVLATVHWSLFIAADSIDPNKGYLYYERNNANESVNPALSDGKFNNAHKLGWEYLQRARHFERMRLNEQYERLEYEHVHSEKKNAGPLDDVARSFDPNIHVVKNMEDLDETDQQILDDSQSNSIGNNRRNRDDKVLHRRLSAEERVNLQEQERNSAQSRHVVKFFEKGFWERPHDKEKEKEKKTVGSDVPDNDEEGTERSPGTRSLENQMETGSKSTIPIFIVGFFRSGSTLLETLLEKHATATASVFREKDDFASESVWNTTVEGKGEEAAFTRGSDAEKLGFRRGAVVWGMGENSPFVFEMYAMQEDTLAAFAGLEAQKKKITSDDSGNLFKRTKKLKKQLEKLDTQFMREYRGIIDQHAQSIVEKMVLRFHEMHYSYSKHTDYSSYTTCNNSSSTRNVNCTDHNKQLARPPLYIVDKMLTNYINIGLIHLVFPDAIILHTVRDPLDTLFSCYSNRFGDASAAYTLHLSSLVERYVNYLEIMAHFRTVLPYVNSTQRGAMNKKVAKRRQALIDVRYEELVANPDRVIRHLLEDVMGIKYSKSNETYRQERRRQEEVSQETVNSSVLESEVSAIGATSNIRTVIRQGQEINEVKVVEDEKVEGASDGKCNATAHTTARGEAVRVVLTASRLQVKAPVYAHSVGRWRKYAAPLNESIIPELRGHLSRLAALGALPYLDPTSSLAHATVLADSSSPSHQQMRYTRSKCETNSNADKACVYINWDLDEMFRYDKMLVDLA